MIVGDSLTSDMQGDAAPASCAAGTTLWGAPPGRPRIDYDIRDLRQVEQILDRAGGGSPRP